MSKSLASLVLVGLSTLGSSNNGHRISYNLTVPPVTTIKGIPLSVQQNGDFGKRGEQMFNLATVLDVDGKKVLASGYNSTTLAFNGHPSLRVLEAAALIQSEMNDGDNEPIELTGEYSGNRFNIQSVTANGYRINF